MRVEHLIYKINQIRHICIYNIFISILLCILIVLLETNYFVLGGYICLLALYTTCFFLTNEIIDKYKNLKGRFEMSKEEFGGFFKGSSILRVLIILLFILFMILWTFILFNHSFLIGYMSTGEILCFSIFLTFLIWSIKQIIDAFVTIVYLTRIIHYVSKNNLII